MNTTLTNSNNYENTKKDRRQESIKQVNLTSWVFYRWHLGVQGPGSRSAKPGVLSFLSHASGHMFQLNKKETSGNLYSISEVTRSVVNLSSLRDLKVSFERVICSACPRNSKIQLSKQMCKDVQVLVVLFRHMENWNRWCRTSLSRRQTRSSLHFFDSIPVDAAYVSTFGPAVGWVPDFEERGRG